MRVLVAGLGSIGQRHMRNLRALRGADIRILAWRVRGLGHVITEQMTIAPHRSVASEYGIEEFTDLDAALAMRPHVTIVANPTSLHAATAGRALEAGSHVLVEKPLSHSDEGVDRLVTLARERGLRGAVAYQLRFHPAILRLRELLDAGTVGRILHVDVAMGEYLPDAHPYEDYRQSYAARRELGGGAVLCLIHEFDYACWIFGMPRQVCTIGGRFGGLEMDVEDTALTTMQCDGRFGSVPVQVRQCFAQRPPSRTCSVFGDAGAIHVDLNAPSLVALDARGRRVHEDTFPGFTRNQLFLDELAHFLRAVDTGSDPAVPLEEGARSLRVALAARASLVSGRPEEVRA